MNFIAEMESVGGNLTFGFNESHMFADMLYYDMKAHPAFKGVFILVYSVIIALGITGNTMVCMAIVRNKKLHNSTYIFIGNLSVSDATVCLVCLPFTLASSLSDSGNWSFGKVLCYVIRPLQPIAVFVSILTMTAISIDRYIIVLYPFKKRLSLRLVGCTVLAIYVLSISLATPLIININYHEFTFVEVNYKAGLCTERWSDNDQRKIYSTFVFILQYALPLFVVSTAYYRVWAELQRQVRPGAVSLHKKKQEIMRKKKTNKMLITVVVCFIACWLPFNMLIITGDYHQELTDFYWYDLIYHVCHVVAMSSTCINPFIYGGLDEIFHKEFLKIIRCVISTSRHSTTGHGDITLAA